MFDRKVSAVLCSTDLARSQQFYEQQVGLERSPATVPNHLLFECGDGTTLLVYRRPGPGKADHTQVRFWTSDVEADVRDLSARGVIFEEYDFPTLKTINHVATTALPPRGRACAWGRKPPPAPRPRPAPSAVARLAGLGSSRSPARVMIPGVLSEPMKRCFTS